MRVRELMTRDVKTVRADENLNRAAQIMWESDCGVVPVTDDAGRIEGMLTDRDVCMSAYFKGAPLRNLRVRDTMSKRVTACSLDATIETAMTMMKEARVRRLPVVDGSGKMVGLLSLNDLAREAAKQRKTSGQPPIAIDVAETLGVICELRPPVVPVSAKTEAKRTAQLAGSAV